MSSLAARDVICRYYDELWNPWAFHRVDELIAPDISFRGSLAVTVADRAGFADYMRLVQSAFPDFHNTIEGLIAEGDRVAVRLTYRGTHRGPLVDLAASGRRISYAGLAMFRVADGRVAEGFVLGDTAALMKQLRA